MQHYSPQYSYNLSVQANQNSHHPMIDPGLISVSEKPKSLHKQLVASATVKIMTKTQFEI